ncbi:MAG TPA: M48 family metalloprotease [Casimicrobiaceae bacterium]|nr:M48 family metalloprotease [Casimicrobiaceae bacterium]
MGTFSPSPPKRPSLARSLVSACVATALALQPVGPAMLGASAAQAQETPVKSDATQSIYAPARPPAEPSPQAPTTALPDLGDESQSLVSPAQERKLGESVVRQIRAAGAYLDDPEVNDYLNDLGQRLVVAVPDSTQSFEFFAVGDPSINAFALPGGYVGVNTGLILLTQSESELAAVLAHEITHVTQHHFTRAMAGQQRSLLYTLAALAVAIAASRSNSSSAAPVTNAAIASAQAIAMQSQLNYTRENEYEADRIGFQRLDAAGFDDTAMATMMQRLQKQTRFGESNAPSYLRTHPITYARIAEAQARAQGKPYRQVPDSLDFQMVRALLKSYTGTPQEAVAWFDDAIKEHKYNSEVAAHYGLVASLLRAGDLKRAKVELATLEKMAPPHPMVEAMAGHVYMDSGDLDAAIARFRAALVRYPNKMQLVYDYPEALLKAKRPKEAVDFVERELQRFPDSGPLHRIAAQAYADLGKKMQQYRHQGEFYAWQGDLRGAVYQLELATKAGDGDFYQASVVEARLRTLRRELAEQQAAQAKNG